MQAAWCLVLSGKVVCAICLGLLKINSCYRRHCRDENGTRLYGWVAQGHCEACKKYPSLIPEFIMPYKHYKAEVVERVVAESEGGGSVERLGGCSADVSTMRRWDRQFKVRGVKAVGWLVSTLITLRDIHVSSLELANRALLKQLARLLHEYPQLRGDSVIGRTNIILTARNCGFL